MAVVGDINVVGDMNGDARRNCGDMPSLEPEKPESDVAGELNEGTINGRKLGIRLVTLRRDGGVVLSPDSEISES
jgi:hypothetical protein